VVLTPDFPHRLYLPVVLKGGMPAVASPYSDRNAAFGWPSLRVPVYAAVRPASRMQAAQATLDFTGVTTASLSLFGQGLDTGPAYPTDTLSLVSAFELAEADPNDPGQIDRAELSYLGAGNDFGAAGTVTATTLFFALATRGNWSAPLAPEVQFKVFLDTDRDGTDDFVLSNDTLDGQASDVFYSRLDDLSSSASSYPLPINYFPASVYDTEPFNTNVMILAVPASAVGLTPANPQFRYRAESYAENSLISAGAVHTYTAGTPGLDFSGGLSGVPIWPDLPSAAIPVTFDAAAYRTNGSIGALILHHHNAAPDRTEIVSISP